MNFLFYGKYILRSKDNSIFLFILAQVLISSENKHRSVYIVQRLFSKHNIDVHGCGKSSPFPVHLFNFLNRFGGEFAPGGAEAASDCVSGGDDV